MMTPRSQELKDATPVKPTMGVAANESQLTAEEREESVRRMRGELASYLADVVSVWTAGKPSLVALKLTDPSSANSIKVEHPAATNFDNNKTITLQQSQEGIIEIDMFNDIDASRWVGRAIMERQTGTITAIFADQDP
jgi:uncharacterized Zn finger protein